jgi:hypothetical protein
VSTRPEALPPGQEAQQGKRCLVPDSPLTPPPFQAPYRAREGEGSQVSPPLPSPTSVRAFACLAVGVWCGGAQQGKRCRPPPDPP